MTRPDDNLERLISRKLDGELINTQKAGALAQLALSFDPQCRDGQRARRHATAEFEPVVP